MPEPVPDAPVATNDMLFAPNREGPDFSRAEGVMVRVRFRLRFASPIWTSLSPYRERKREHCLLQNR